MQRPLYQVADPTNLSAYVSDMFQRIMVILQDALTFFETLILNLPGIKGTGSA